MRRRAEIRYSNDESLVCPYCEEGLLMQTAGALSRCTGCGRYISKAVVETLADVTGLPDVIGSHACECGHPQMRRLPDGVFWCPACGDEVLPPENPARKPCGDCQ